MMRRRSYYGTTGEKTFFLWMMDPPSFVKAPTHHDPRNDARSSAKPQEASRAVSERPPPKEEL